ncbi:DNA methyltransferase [Aliidiomarina sanyensis]|uniref:site-specific DNA-methyltransferase (adenine-specific) n=1 Tax=Aliidiomarina sanyensis TaxID=1249555 RepID=A0A432WPI4_9GAMM|nr:site-specific DNA-methyltransferase [Aliidiomarina sanyensis]RUO35702.1 hypothetical protein CWE11_02785 [Aliidiomarina sanyensis]
MQNLLKELEDLLHRDQSFISDGAILKNSVIEAALKMDVRLLALLLESETIKAHFFTEVGGAMVFDKTKFQDFVSNKAFLPDSYTTFKNRIGLTGGRGNYLSQSHEVVLDWPYKDCVLEGGMTKEDIKRDEVFWNTTLAPDDITRLFEPKVLAGWKRWDAEAVEAGKAKSVGQILEDDNLLIKGNNLLALHSLKARYSGKVKLIYIDPPYNTGDDSFRYNDRFRHSTWLSFMKNRLSVARELLRYDGHIYIQVDDSEHAYLKVLLDEVMGRENFIACIAYERSGVSGLGQGGAHLTNTHEFILLYAKDKGKSKTNDSFVSEEIDFEVLKRYNKVFVDAGDSELVTKFKSPATGEDVIIRKHPNAKIDTISLRSFDDRKPEIIKEVFDKFDLVFRTTSVQKENTFQNQILDKCSSGLYSAEYLVSRGRDKGKVVTSYYLNKSVTAWLKDTAVKEKGTVNKTNQVSQFWSHRSIPKADLANEGGVTLNRGKKPEALLKRIIELSTVPGDIVLDFFAGSNTTSAVAHKMSRQWIAIEQMSYVNGLTDKRLKNVIEGEQGGISKAVGWQGGGSFVYAELAASNSTFADRIREATDMAELKIIYADIQATGYIRYDADLSCFNTDDFAALSLEDGKQALMDILDTNHLYVNFGSLGDADYDISDENVRMTRSFYGVDK